MARLCLIASAVALLTIAAACSDAPANEAERIADTQQRVEQIRGLTAEGEVPIRLLPRDEAAAELLSAEDYDEAIAEVAAEARVMKRLGLLPQDLDAVALVEQATTEGVLGYYDGDTRTMTIISDDELGDTHVLTLAHEHMHALQDQHFGFEPFDVDLDADQTAAFSALVEGEATIVEAMYAVRRLSVDSIESIEASELSSDIVIFEDQPELYLREGEFPYLDGAVFVLHHFRQGGWEAIDEAWASPPVSSEQILHPERYPDDVPTPIDMPDVAGSMGPGWSSPGDLTMGEMRTGVLLADGIPGVYAEQGFESPRLPHANGAAGWDGDRLIELQGPGEQWALVWQTTWDTAADAVEFEAALRLAFTDLPASWSIDVDGSASASALAHPVLVLLANDEPTRAEVQLALS